MDGEIVLYLSVAGRYIYKPVANRKGGKPACYRPKETYTSMLSPLAKQILRAAIARCDASGADIQDHLLRLYGGRLTAAEFAPLTDEGSSS